MRRVVLLSTVAAGVAVAATLMAVQANGTTPEAVVVSLPTASPSPQASPEAVATRPPLVATTPSAAPKPRPVVTHPAAKPVAVATHATVATHAPRPPVVRVAPPKPVVTHAPSQTAQPSGTDDYPYKSASGSPSDPWGFTERQCVSFAAWRLTQHGHTVSNATQHWGDALHWDDTAQSLGMGVTTTATVGSIAQWNAGESSPYYGPGSSKANGTFTASQYGHVAWVKAVYADGSALVEQYNMGGDRAYSVSRVRAPRYLRIS